jgi:pyrroline-5-carboxylate reductase
MQTPRIVFVGGGNMAASLIGGLISDRFPAERIWVCDPSVQRLEELRNRFLVNTTPINHEAVAHGEVVVLAVKPQLMKEVCQEIGPKLAARPPLVVSVAAGIPTPSLARWLGDLAIVRAMPNTPAMVGCGATALFANHGTSAEQRTLAESLLRSVGTSIWIDDESLMDAVTAVSGSGPAYFFYMMEVMERAAIELGLAPAAARILTLQTALGAAKMAIESNDDPATLRRKVTSPGGTTERAVGVLNDKRFANVIQAAVTAAAQRSRELAELFGEKQ